MKAEIVEKMEFSNSSIRFIWKLRVDGDDRVHRVYGRTLREVEHNARAFIKRVEARVARRSAGRDRQFQAEGA